MTIWRKLRPFLPPGYYEEFQFPEATFTITPTGDYTPRQDYLDATEKFAGQVQLTADRSLEAYVAGQPFPTDQLDPADPLAGVKIGWNFNYRWQHYGQKVGNFAVILIKPGGTHEPLSGLPPDLIQSGGDRRAGAHAALSAGVSQPPVDAARPELYAAGAGCRTIRVERHDRIYQPI